MCGIMKLKSYWSSRQKEVEKGLHQYLPKKSVKPATIHESMRYSIFAGGKRLRPILTLAAADVISGKHLNAIPSACAVECIHTYSLIHDDLPCMDNDDFRRGKPTNHKVYGDGIAVLAGDALLTIAFEMTAKTKPTSRYSVAHYIQELAFASGSLMLIAGQVGDIEAEGKKANYPHLRWIHERKTAALIRSSIRLGAMSANATPSELKALTDFGNNLGLAFQVVDDILDITQTTEKLGKSAGKDLKAEKSTYPALLGLEGAQKEAKRLTQLSMKAIQPLGKKAEPLLAIADFMLNRES